MTGTATTSADTDLDESATPDRRLGKMQATKSAADREPAHRVAATSR